MNEHLPVFVYGTLKRGECRERCWPRPPLSIEPATTHGRLFDLGPYPALVPGDDPIRGELWRLRPEDLDETLRVLDGIEGCVGQEDDQYHRVVIDCQDEAGRTCRAYAYHYGLLDRLVGLSAIAPSGDGYCVWPVR